MSLAQSIVIKNEYTIKQGKGGSRGGTPGSYVMRYMARDGAVENLTPIRYRDADDYVLRYMARRDAVDEALDLPEAKDSMNHLDGLGGVAFGYGDISLSDEKLRASAKDIQAQFEKGKTVLKTVLSFDEEYLKEMGVLEPTFKFRKKGDFKGKVDQMKLRGSIMDGLDRMGKNYDDLRYIGVIQIDTAHLHAHLTMVDGGEGDLMGDGTQRGKLLDKHKKVLRRGIDMSLGQKEKIKHLSSSVTYDKRNAVSYLKGKAHTMMKERSFSQFLLATLPEDRTLWRAETNRKEMKKPNAIVKEYVEDIYAEPNSGYREAMQSIETYARERQSREGLTTEEYGRLVRQGGQRVLYDGMNAVYGVLRQVPKEDTKIETPMLSMMSMNYEEMADASRGDPMIEFGFKLRSYSSRLSHHKKEKSKWKDLARRWEDSTTKVEDSKPLYEFFKVEEEYNSMLMSKYQNFLQFLPPGDTWKGEFDKIMDYDKKREALRDMYNDPSFNRMQSEKSAEEYGRRVYEMYGGRHMIGASFIIEDRIERMDERYARMVEDFRESLTEHGLKFDGKGVKRGTEYAFDDVKALDLHHLGYDFLYDVSISEVNINHFIDMSDRRAQAFDRAKEYLVGSGQEKMLEALPQNDIKHMRELADSLRDTDVLESKRTNKGGRRRAQTISLSDDYNPQIKLAVASSLAMNPSLDEDL